MPTGSETLAPLSPVTRATVEQGQQAGQQLDKNLQSEARQDGGRQRVEHLQRETQVGGHWKLGSQVLWERPAMWQRAAVAAMRRCLKPLGLDTPTTRPGQAARTGTEASQPVTLLSASRLCTAVTGMM